ncbi:MAG: Thioredoxin reductase [Alphaproteobacteria bacterium MarineAlpha9_Bin3]|nr:MAG: Thioredoxin reductase [Alphaproteobacteria bacterium MarineAlpha9_Bin3]|tara:strand:+ start:10496 stop:11446 length:951 start_codon:yes stop_codon:yes gene_type:complete
MTKNHHKLIILGSGPAGCTAAIYAARAGLKPLLIRGLEPGGQLTITTDVDNYPGYENTIQGPWLMEQMEKQALSVGTQLISGTVIKCDLTKNPIMLELDNGENYFADSCIIATGASARWLNIPSETKYRGFGVSACATCDGFFYRNKEVMVVGGGNTAVEEALFLTNFASKVTLVHRRSELRAEKILQERLFKNEKISIIWDHVLEEVLGTDSPLVVNKAILKSTKNDKNMEIDISGIFIAIGHDPNTKLFVNQLNMDEENYIITANDSTKTNIEGVYAAGDVQDKIYRQAVTAAGHGCMAALEAEKYLSLKDKSL